jgi:hypothetical protein
MTQDTISINNVHSLRKLELTFKFMYFLRDIGIKSAKDPASKLWAEYVNILSKIGIEGMSCS